MTKLEDVITGKIASLTRMPNSNAGNPRWRITLESGVSFVTSKDTSMGYFIDTKPYIGSRDVFSGSKNLKVYAPLLVFTMLQGQATSVGIVSDAPHAPVGLSLGAL